MTPNLMERAGVSGRQDECEFGTCLRQTDLRTLAPNKTRDKILKAYAAGAEWHEARMLMRLKVYHHAPSFCAGRTEYTDDRRSDTGDGLSDAPCGRDVISAV